MSVSATNSIAAAATHALVASASTVGLRDAGTLFGLLVIVIVFCGPQPELPVQAPIFSTSCSSPRSTPAWRWA